MKNLIKIALLALIVATSCKSPQQIVYDDNLKYSEGKYNEKVGR